MTILDTIFAVLTGVLGWLIEGITSVVGVFYDAQTGLTFIGIMALIGLAIGIGRLVLAWVRSLIKGRG